MPAFCTHYIFAKEIFDGIQSNVDFEMDFDAYQIGAQGPDIFFFHRVLPWMIGKPLRTYGMKMHRMKPDMLFENMRKFIDLSKEDIAHSYILGFLTHYALDRKCHPYVYSIQEKMVNKRLEINPNSAHNIIEFNLDTYMLNKRMGVDDISNYDASKLINYDDETITCIASLYDYICPKISEQLITTIDIKNALGDAKTIEVMMMDNSIAKRKAVGALEGIASPLTKSFKLTSMIRPKDLKKAEIYANINNNKWVSPFSKENSNKNFVELFEEAQIEAIDIIKGFEEGKPIKDLTNNLSFLTGVEVE